MGTGGGGTSSEPERQWPHSRRCLTDVEWTNCMVQISAASRTGRKLAKLSVAPPLTTSVTTGWTQFGFVIRFCPLRSTQLLHLSSQSCPFSFSSLSLFPLLGCPNVQQLCTYLTVTFPTDDPAHPLAPTHIHPRAHTLLRILLLHTLWA